MVVTGLSGSGITTALNALEDDGAFCIDNLPPALVPRLIELTRDARLQRHLAVGLDARSVTDSRDTLRILQHIEEAGVNVTILFVEASDHVLLRRFSASRRPHPLGRTLSISLPEAIRAERQAMHPFREAANLIVDTSDMNVHELKRRVRALAAGDAPEGLALAVVSFGFRYGLPPEADVVWDVRFLPNPHFIEELRPRTGIDRAVADHVLLHPATRSFLERFFPLLEVVLPEYEQEGKSYLTVAVGCTGGRHRSVAIAEAVAERLRGLGYAPSVRHRDIDKETT
jgi:UPF0042 nucleotide-binding protein